MLTIGSSIGWEDVVAYKRNKNSRNASLVVQIKWKLTYRYGFPYSENLIY